MNVSKFTTWTFAILFIFSLVLVVHLLFGFITPMIMALVLVSIFAPLHHKIEKWLNYKRHLAALLSTMLVSIFVLAPIVFFTMSLSKEVLHIYQISSNFSNEKEFEEYISTIKSSLGYWQEFFNDFNIKISPEKSLEKVILFINEFGKKMYDFMAAFLANIISIFFSFILTILFVFVFFLSGSSIKQFLMDLIPLPDLEKEMLIRRFSEISIAVFMGNGLISFLEGLIGGFLFWLFLVPGHLIWGLAITVAAFLPLVGSSIVVIPASIYIYIKQDMIMAVIFFILNMFQLTFLDTYIKSKLISGKSHMHAVLVFLSIIAGVQVYGIFGLFYGPLLVTMFLALAQIYHEHYRDKLLKE